MPVCKKKSHSQFDFAAVKKSIKQLSYCYKFYCFKQNDHSAKFSSKGKTPWMEYNGKTIADSQFCIEYLKSQLGVDVNSHLTKDLIGTSKAFQRLTEENLYW
jgi:hypothetical protein